MLEDKMDPVITEIIKYDQNHSWSLLFLQDGGTP